VTTRVLALIGFLGVLPLIFIGVAVIGRRVVEKRHAQELPGEVKAGSDDDWLQRTINGS
jgi:hypothetical protein